MHRAWRSGGISKRLPVPHRRTVGQHQGEVGRQQAAELAHQHGFLQGGRESGSRGAETFKGLGQHGLRPGLGLPPVGGQGQGSKAWGPGSLPSERNPATQPGGRQPTHQPGVTLAGHASQGIQRTGIGFGDQHLPRLQGSQPALQPPTRRQGSQPQHLVRGEARVRALQQQVVGGHGLQLRLATEPREGIGKHGPTGAPLQLDQGPQMGAPLRWSAAPGPCHHNSGPIRIQALASGYGGRGFCRGNQDLGDFLGRSPLDLVRPGLQQGATGMKGFFKGQVEVHRARGTALLAAYAPKPGLHCQGINGRPIQARHTRWLRLSNPTATAAQKILLIDTLVGSAAL